MSVLRVNRNGLFCVALAILLLATARTGHAQTYPARKIDLVVAFAAGGFADTLARIVGQKLNARWGQPVVIENRTGAGGDIAAKHVAGSPPDGYTVLVTTTAVAVNETLHKTRILSIGDLVPVAVSASAPEVLVAHPSNPSNNLVQFLGWAKDRHVTYGTAIGTGSHIAAEYFFKILNKTNATLVPFRGGAPAVSAALGNQIDSFIGSLPSIAQQVNDGQLKGLAVASKRRTATLPNVPTFAESGFPDFEAASWVGFFVPAQTKPDVIAKLNEAINETIADAAIQKQLADLGYETMQISPPDAVTFFRGEVDTWAKMVRTVGITMD
jgi:tripartite-type tricarboxylate transporter receptor subunit TctC